ncbi:MAG: hypothetical protein ABIN97_07160 [Ginsengibacter sp.]
MIALFFICLNINNNESKLKKIQIALIKETKKAMADLNIGIRDNLEKDEPFLIIVDSSIKELNAKFTMEYGFDSGKKDLASRWYKEPRIRISPIFYSILLKIRDTSNLIYLQTKSIIAHELTHYLQKSIMNDFAPYTALGDPDMEQKSLTEFEAYSIGCYYFLSKYNSGSLKKIMNSLVSPKEKMILIMNVATDIFFPDSR